MRRLILAAALAVWAIPAELLAWGPNDPTGDVAIPENIQANGSTLGDDVLLCFGTAGNYCIYYDSTANTFTLWSTDVDGAGADQALLTCADGTEDCTFLGLLTVSGGIDIDGDNLTLTLGAGGALDSALYFDGTDLRISVPSGVMRLNAPIVAGFISVNADTGNFPWINQNMTSGLSDGTEVCGWARLDNTNVLAFCAEADGSDGVDEKSFKFEGMNGAYSKWTRDQETLTFAGGGEASKTWTGAVPVGAVEYYFVTRTLVAGTTCADAEYGDGSDRDAYGLAVAVTAGTTTTPADYTANVNNNVITTAEDFVITGTNGSGVAANCASLSVRVEAFYKTFSAPTN